MAENFDPGFFLDVAPEAKFRFNIINRHAAWLLTQRLDFEDRKGVAGLRYDFIELAMQRLERVDFEDAFDADGPRDRRVVVPLPIAETTAPRALVSPFAN